MLKLDENYKGNIIDEEYFKIYTSNKVPYLKLIEFKGIGVDIGNDPEIIGEGAYNCINNMINSNSRSNYNDIIHCIWYCTTGTRFEDKEVSLFKKLKEAYNDVSLPIIIVYTKTVDRLTAKNFKSYILNDLKLEASFVKVLAFNSDNQKYTFGDYKLLRKTLFKFNNALKGEMINLMTKSISSYIKEILFKDNKQEKEIIIKNIILKFNSEYKIILTDEEFKNYVVELLGKNLINFYKDYKEKISNKTLNLIKQSNIITKIEDFIKYYQEKVEDMIKPIIKEKSEILIDKQATLEKKENQNMKLVNKRDLNCFKKTTEIFLKRNFYYISQKYIIDSIIKNICSNYFLSYKNKLDEIITNLLEKNKDLDIKNFLDDCFYAKLEKFIEGKNKIEINYPQINYIKKDFIKEQLNDDEKFNMGDIIQKSIELVGNFNYPIVIKDIALNDNQKDKWYPFIQKNWKYLTGISESLLKNFLEKEMLYQDSYFYIDTNDVIFKSLKVYEKNDLINFFYNNKKNFILKDINKYYNSKYIYCRNLQLSNITQSQQVKDIYIDKINEEVEKLNQDKNYCKINYISIILIGKTGVGKSTLINGMLKEYVAQTGVGQIVTKENTAYLRNSFPFLRSYDTRGIELEKDFSPENILKNILKIINAEKRGNNNAFYNYIQCIWYCINSSEIEQKEIEVMKKLKENYKAIPFIVVFSYAHTANIINEAYKKIKNIFNDISFIPVLAKSIEGFERMEKTDSFGLNNLLNETLKICKKTIKGDIFKKIREISFNKIQTIFKERNKSIKIKIINDIVNDFTNNFKKVLDKDELYEYIFKLFEKFFETNINKNLSDENKKYIKDIINMEESINKYIKYYDNCTQKIVEPILYEKAIEFLDLQAKIEKKKRKKY